MDGKNWRIPGWCDRIMFHHNLTKIKLVDRRLVQVAPEQEITNANEASLVLVNYDSATHVFGSDHRPVFA